MRYLVISDIHGNLEALTAVLEDIDRQQVDSIYCLGDVVGYGPNPCECVKLVRDRCSVVLLGNHDQGALFDPDGFNVGAERAIPNYNTMGVAQAGLEAATRYAARDLGPKGIRVNAISAGAMRTLSLAGISGGRGMLAQGRAMSAMKEDTSMEGVAGAALWLLSDLGRSTTGEVVHVDAGFHIMGIADDAEA